MGKVDFLSTTPQIALIGKLKSEYYCITFIISIFNAHKLTDEGFG